MHRARRIPSFVCLSDWKLEMSDWKWLVWPNFAIFFRFYLKCPEMSIIGEAEKNSWATVPVFHLRIQVRSLQQDLGASPFTRELGSDGAARLCSKALMLGQVRPQFWMRFYMNSEMGSIGIYWNLLESIGIYWNLLESIAIYWIHM